MVYTWQYLVYFSRDDQVAVPKVKKKEKKSTLTLWQTSAPV